MAAGRPPPSSTRCAVPIEHAQRHLNARQVAELTLCGRTFAGQEGCKPLRHRKEWPGRAMRRALRACMQLWAPGLSRGSTEAATSTAGQQRGRSAQSSPPSVPRASWRARAGQSAPVKPHGDVRERVHARRRAHPLVDCIRLCCVALSSGVRADLIWKASPLDAKKIHSETLWQCCGSVCTGEL